ncbi:glycosyltransferase family 2 protein [Methylobacterium sp. NEAU K]|uniref:glycosyltransferase family 2 protein n=1 Tax=Methylobacterium sp. NEAU K TaxID=3064946 RepID=UPI0027354635|nr:glycosyltransferase family 2 protein [Methylobacterium sp. NEAU K]MDP4004402.1 glycosyltransferase family 2 protein [Methylobacterium sp. NEAU K]
MATGPTIAVVITCFNYEAYVGRAIQSVISQNIADCELVVVDDGSTDGSWDVIQRAGVRAFRIANSGQRSACLYGLSHTRAPFVLFLDADDELLPGAIEQILKRLDPGVAKVQFCLTCVDASGHVIADPYPALEAFRGQDKIVNEILRSGVYQTPPTSGNVFRRDVCEVLHQCDYDRAVDGVILLIAPFLGDVVSLSESLGLYRVHGRNDSGLGRKPQAMTFDRDLRRFQLRLAHLRRLLREMRPDVVLVETEKTYYFRLMEFSAAIFRGVRCGFRSFLMLLRTVFTEPRPVKWKVSNALFLLALSLAPIRQAQALLAFRFSVGRRSVYQFLRAANVSKQE